MSSSSSSSPAQILELLPLYAMGALDANESAEVERALAANPGLTSELDRWRDAIAAFGAAAPAVAPAAGVRERLLASIDAGGSRFERFVAQLAELFAVTADGARAMLATVDDAAAWRPLMPGIDCIRVSGSNNPAQAQCAFVRVAAGTTFPWHHHAGEERSLVLHGGAHMADGRDLGPGDLLVVDESVEHDFVIEGDEACIFAVRSGGMLFGPKPR
ncbi:MAG TPA: cupin domain-containing protein [Kofleriaceae bacterium]|nr:cupin domain-containing protein [Kofleriaceae bacterium]